MISGRGNHQTDFKSAHNNNCHRILFLTKIVKKSLKKAIICVMKILKQVQDDGISYSTILYLDIF